MALADHQEKEGEMENKELRAYVVSMVLLALMDLQALLDHPDPLDSQVFPDRRETVELEVLKVARVCRAAGAAPACQDQAVKQENQASEVEMVLTV